MKVSIIVICILLFPLILSACGPALPPGFLATTTAQSLTLEAYNHAAAIASKPAPGGSAPGFPIPIPSVLKQRLVNPQALGQEMFDKFPGAGWDYSDNVSIQSNGGKSLQLSGRNAFSTYVASPAFSPGQGILAWFKLSGPGVEFFIAQNERDTPSYKRFGGAIYITNRMETIIRDGSDNHLSNQEMSGPLEFNSEDWYGLFIGADKNGGLHFLVWNWVNPDQVAWHEFQGGSAWASGQWRFFIQADKGRVLLDDFTNISFDAFRTVMPGGVIPGTLTPTLNTSPTAPPAGVPYVNVSTNAFCRTGPGEVYDSVGILVIGETAEVVGRSSAEDFWIIKNPDVAGTLCWLQDQYATVTGATGSLPVFQPPPLPPTPTFTPIPTYPPMLTLAPSPTQGPMLQVEPNPVPPDSYYDIYGSGFPPGKTVQTRFLSRSGNTWTAGEWGNWPVSVTGSFYTRWANTAAVTGQTKFEVYQDGKLLASVVFITQGP